LAVDGQNRAFRDHPLQAVAERDVAADQRVDGVGSCAIHENRLATNKQSNTVPDVTAVTVMLNRLPAALENTGTRRPGPGVGLRFGFLTDRFFVATNQIPFSQASA
jgi:hypothetical protein